MNPSPNANGARSGKYTNDDSHASQDCSGDGKKGELPSDLATSRGLRPIRMPSGSKAGLVNLTGRRNTGVGRRVTSVSRKEKERGRRVPLRFPVAFQQRQDDGQVANDHGKVARVNAPVMPGVQDRDQAVVGRAPGADRRRAAAPAGRCLLQFAEGRSG